MDKTDRNLGIGGTYELDILLLAVAMLAIMQCGCGAYSQACGVVLAQEVALQGKLADAQRARAELDRSGLRDVLPPAQRARYDQALALLDRGYADAVAGLALVHDACSAPDVAGALRLIVQGWQIVAPMLALIGGTGTPAVSLPVLYTEAVQ